MALTRNEFAGLATIAVSEGTYGRGDDGYNVLVGNGLFTSYTDHPKILITVQPEKVAKTDLIRDGKIIYRKGDVIKKALKSTAAGRYQINWPTFKDIKQKAGVKDFSPASQDQLCLYLIKTEKALTDLNIGNFDAFIHKCSNRWASFPGAGYGQHENTIAKLREVYIKFGGKIGSA